MNNVIQLFPRSCHLPFGVLLRKSHLVRVRVLDKKNPKRTRWEFQLVVQNAASFRALKGFTDSAVRRNKVHDFKIITRSRLRQFLNEARPFIIGGKVSVTIDGRAVTPMTSPAKPDLAVIGGNRRSAAVG